MISRVQQQAAHAKMHEIAKETGYESTELIDRLKALFSQSIDFQFSLNQEKCSYRHYLMFMEFLNNIYILMDVVTEEPTFKHSYIENHCKMAIKKQVCACCGRGNTKTYKNNHSERIELCEVCFKKMQRIGSKEFLKLNHLIGV